MLVCRVSVSSIRRVSVHIPFHNAMYRYSFQMNTLCSYFAASAAQARGAHDVPEASGRLLATIHIGTLASTPPPNGLAFAGL